MLSADEPSMRVIESMAQERAMELPEFMFAGGATFEGAREGAREN